MIVHISATPEVSPDLVGAVFEELNTVHGEIKFKFHSPITEGQFRMTLPLVADINNSLTLRFEDFFSLCNSFRIIKDFPQNEFSVILTSIKNRGNWFSACIDKNIFVDINDWEEFTGKEPQFGIAYQVVENVFQSLININYQNAETHPNVHYEDEGCINEFCGNKKKIIIKLKTAEICTSCQQRALELGVSEHIIHHIENIIQKIRENIISKITIKKPRLETLKVEHKGNLKIGDKDIKMEALPKSLYIYTLAITGNLELDNLQNKWNEIFSIYQKIRRSGEESKIRNMTLIPKEINSTFDKNKSILNKSLIEQLPEDISNYYTLNTVGIYTYSISVRPDFVWFDPTF